MGRGRGWSIGDNKLEFVIKKKGSPINCKKNFCSPVKKPT